MPLKWVSAKPGTEPSPTPRVAVLLINWNQWGLTIECLESVFRLDYPDLVVVLCDNDSSDESVERVRAWASGSSTEPLRRSNALLHLSDPPVAKPIKTVELTREQAESWHGPASDARLVLIRNGANLGFAGGNNVGMRYIAARGDLPIMWILNNDTVVAPDSLRNLVGGFLMSGASGAGATMMEYSAPDVVQAAGGGVFSKRRLFPALVGEQQLGNGRRPRVDFISGACILARTHDIVRAGFFDEAYFIYGEDIDLSLKLEQLGTHVAYVPSARIWHRGGGEQGYRHPRHDYYTTRNTMLLVRKYYPRMMPIAVGYLVYRIFLPKVVRGQWGRLAIVWRAWLDFLNNRFGKAF